MMLCATSAAILPFLATSITVAPALANATAAAAPMPRLAPVTMMTLPVRLLMQFDSSAQPRFTGPRARRQTGEGSGNARIDGTAGARLVGLRHGRSPGR